MCGHDFDVILVCNSIGRKRFVNPFPSTALLEVETLIVNLFLLWIHYYECQIFMVITSYSARNQCWQIACYCPLPMPPSPLPTASEIEPLYKYNSEVVSCRPVCSANHKKGLSRPVQQEDTDLTVTIWKEQHLPREAARPSWSVATRLSPISSWQQPPWCSHCRRRYVRHLFISF